MKLLPCSGPKLTLGQPNGWKELSFHFYHVYRHPTMKEPETACSSSIRLGVLREVIILLIGRLKNQNCQKRLNKKVVNNIINGHFARVYGQN